MRQFSISANAGDLHIGYPKVSPKETKRLLRKYLVEPLEAMNYLDFINLPGDMLHDKISMDSEYSEVFFWLINKIYKIAKKKDSAFIIVKGTKSHDNEQLNNIKYLQNNDDGVYFRIVDLPEVLEVKGKRILCLPDIKEDNSEKVDELLKPKKPYDMILGHGLIDSMKYFVQESENHPTKTRVFDSRKLMEICNGPVIFGHIHKYTNLKNKFYYTGSFFRLERGYSEKNGWLLCGQYNKDTSKFRVERFINDESPNFYSIQLDKEMIMDYSIDNILSYIYEEIKDSHDRDLIAINIISDGTTISSDKILYIREHFKKDKRVSISIRIKNNKVSIIEEKNKEYKDKYAFVLDNNKTMEEIIYEFHKISIEEDKSYKFSNLIIDIEGIRNIIS